MVSILKEFLISNVHVFMQQYNKDLIWLASLNTTITLVLSVYYTQEKLLLSACAICSITEQTRPIFFHFDANWQERFNLGAAG